MLTWQWQVAEARGEGRSQAGEVLLQGQIVVLLLHSFHLELLYGCLHGINVLAEDGILLLVLCV